MIAICKRCGKKFVMYVTGITTPQGGQCDTCANVMRGLSGEAHHVQGPKNTYRIVYLAENSYGEKFSLEYYFTARNSEVEGYISLWKIEHPNAKYISHAIVR